MKTPSLVFNGLISVPEIKIQYSGVFISPKLDFKKDQENNQKGYIVTDGSQNIMPNNMWFKSVVEARVAVDVIKRYRIHNFIDEWSKLNGLDEWTEV